MVLRLPANLADELASVAFTYDDVGATSGEMPTGYHCFTKSRRLPGLILDEAAGQLLSWRVHEPAGLRVAASSRRVEAGAVVLMRLGVGPVSIRIPCRVVYVVEEVDRVGFAYGTLPGHPEEGEELFLLERDGENDVRFTVSAFSKPATALTRAAGPVGRWAQARMTQRYLSSLTRP